MNIYDKYLVECPRGLYRGADVFIQIDAVNFIHQIKHDSYRDNL